MGREGDRIVIAASDCEALGAESERPTAVADLSADIRSGDIGESPSPDAIFRVADEFKKGVDSSDKRPSIAVVHWDDSPLPALVCTIVGGQASLTGVDLSPVEHDRRAVALGPVFRGLSEGDIDMVVLMTTPSLLEAAASESDHIFLRFPAGDVDLTAITKSLSLGGLFAGDVSQLLPLELGQSLKDARFIDNVGASSGSPGEPYRRTLKKLQSLGVSCLADGSLETSDGGPLPKGAFRLVAGLPSGGAPNEFIVAFSCSDVGEPCAWLSLSTVVRPSPILSVANALLSVVAMPELEWQRWLV